MKHDMQSRPSTDADQQGARPRELDLEAWRRERDAMARAPRIGSLSVDVATLWNGRLARYEARRQSMNPAARPASEPIAAHALTPAERSRMPQVRPGIPRGRCSTLVDTTPALHEIGRDLFRPR